MGPEGTLKVDKDTVLAAPGLALADDDGGHDLFLQIGLALLHRGDDHVADTGCGEAVQTALHALHGDHVQVLCPRVVGAVDHSANRKTEGHAEAIPGNTTTTYGQR